MSITRTARGFDFEGVIVSSVVNPWEDLADAANDAGIEVTAEQLSDVSYYVEEPFEATDWKVSGSAEVTR